VAALASSEQGTSVALLTPDGGLVERSAEGAARHSVHVLPLLAAVLGEAGLRPADLAAVAFTRGPGPFTAGRISTATAQGLGLALGVPLLPVSTLAALAHASGAPRVAAALDAGQGEVYWGLYQRDGDGHWGLAAPEEVAPPDAVARPDGGEWLGAGLGWAAHGAALAERLGERLTDTVPELTVAARAVAAVGAAERARGVAVAPAEALPTYLRASYAQPPA
jgi:tRNA threonylcarbamoyladenosine biosynthesis protein TsaB